MTSAAEIRDRLSRPWRHGQHADFRAVICDGPLDLSGMPVDGVDFTGAHFPDGLDARGACFDGLAWFRGVSFGGPARFDRAAFMNDARFEGARFASPVGFASAEFRGIGRFDDARFESGVDLSNTIFYGNFSLQNVAVTGVVTFRGGEWLGGLWCDGAHLPADADTSDTQVHGRLWLRRARRGNAPLAPSDFGMSFGYAYI